MDQDSTIPNLRVKWMSSNEAAERLGVTTATLYRFIDEGRLPAYRMGRVIRLKENKDGKLEVEWSEGNHTSYYDPNWLRENCYTIKNNKKYVSPYDLWDCSLEKNLETIIINHNEIMETNDGLIKWLELLHHKGIAIIKNALPSEQTGSKTAKK